MFDPDIPEYPFEDEDPNHRWDPHWDRFMRHPLEVDFMKIRLSLKEWRAQMQDDTAWEAELLDNVIDDLEHGIVGIVDAIEEVKRLGLRNPAFDGDMVGWLNDDFEAEDAEADDSDEEEDEEDEEE